MTIDLEFVAVGGTEEENDACIADMLASMPMTEEGRVFLAKIAERQEAERVEKKRVEILELEHSAMLSVLVSLGTITQEDIDRKNILGAVDAYTREHPV